MKHCPNPECPGLEKFKIVSEFEDTASVCSDCGAALALGPAPRPDGQREGRPEPDPDLELVMVGTLTAEPDIILAESQLDEAGIPFFTQGDVLQDLFGMGRLVEVNPLIRPVRFFVPADQAEDARALLEDIRRAESAAVIVEEPEDGSS